MWKSCLTRFVTALSLSLWALLFSLSSPVLSASKPLPQDELRTIAATFFSLDASRVTVSGPSGVPTVMWVENDGNLVGYLASTDTVIGSVGYSGKPIDVLIAIDLNATIRGAKLLAQSEPILTIGISESDVSDYVGSFANIPLGLDKDSRRSSELPDAIVGATVSSGVIRDGIIRTGRAVALAYGLLELRSGRQIDRTGFSATDWQTLLSDGAIAHRLITIGDARKSLAAPDYKAIAGGPEGTFADLYYGLLTPAQIGQNLLGKRAFTELVADTDANDHSLVVAANGLYSFRGRQWRKTGMFERIELHQDDHSIRLTSGVYRSLQRFKLDGAPEFREIAIFTIPAATGFDPTRPWRFSLLVDHESDKDSGVLRTAAFPLHYRLPEKFMLAADKNTASEKFIPLWQRNWLAQIPAIVIVCLHLLGLAAILVFQDSLVPRRRVYVAVRIGFLTVTLVVLGWWLGAQLSVVQILAFAQAFRTGFQWETFLLAPLIFILWSAVAVSLLFWGRGVFCGWLCPFGALQELLNTLAKRLGIPQLDVPFALHERLWPIKYIIFLSLFALSLHSITDAFVFSEVEPFKTAITLKFMRGWPYVAFAAGLLVAGLFIERAYCRYLCPLGAALAIPARLRMFEWLKRRPQCGRECRICAVRCTVQAIHPDGHINPNECIHCLKCQANYYDPATCPPLKARQQRRAAHRAAVAKAAQTGAANEA